MVYRYGRVVSWDEEGLGQASDRRALPTLQPVGRAARFGDYRPALWIIVRCCSSD